MSQRFPEDQEQKDRRGKSQLTKKLSAHRGVATWGDRLVPLSDFRRVARSQGRELSAEDRGEALRNFLQPDEDKTPIEGPFTKIAVFGGIYNNSYGLIALLEDAARRGVEAIYCLGDLGGFGPDPEKIWPLLREGAVKSIQGNYEESLSTGREDCNCGYADPRDNHFAELSYRYTASKCSPEFKSWMGGLPKRRRVCVGGRELLLIHGSPRRINEFMFQSTTPVSYLEVLLDQEKCDGILCTHTGLQWSRRLPSGRDVVNVGVIGRPANDGSTVVWYSVLREEGEELSVDLIPLVYDHRSLAEDMRREKLPEEFAETILSGWWTTCLEILPARERALSRF